MSRTLREPTTTLTDVALSAATAWFAYRLASRGLWVAGFAAAGVAALLGAVAHGFVDFTTRRGHEIIWAGSVFFVGAAAATLAGAAGADVWPQHRRAVVVTLAAVVAVYAIIVARKPLFRFAAMASALALAVFAVLAVTVADTNPAAARWLTAMILVTVAGVAAQARGISLHRHFNNNDLYHVLQLIGFVCLYRAAVALG